MRTGITGTAGPKRVSISRGLVAGSGNKLEFPPLDVLSCADVRSAWIRCHATRVYVQSGFFTAIQRLCMYCARCSSLPLSSHCISPSPLFVLAANFKFESECQWTDNLDKETFVVGLQDFATDITAFLRTCHTIQSLSPRTWKIPNPAGRECERRILSGHFNFGRRDTDR